MPSILWSELEGQPGVLRDLARFYLEGEGLSLLGSLPAAPAPTLTGMGASYHAAWNCALHLNSLGFPAAHVEATDLLHYSAASLGEYTPVVYFSQSGSSAEVEPALKILEGRPLVAVTNETESPLAQQATIALPLLAGKEEWIASKTYLNALTLGWFIARSLAGQPVSGYTSLLDLIADRVQAILDRADETAGDWLERFENGKTLVFLGHGPHAATARQAAMLVSEWAKRPALYASAGAFRHGFIEITGPRVGAVLFAPPGRSQPSTLTLAKELAVSGISVLVVSYGLGSGPEEVSVEAEIDEFLSPVLDILPVQIFVDRLAVKSGIAPGFRHIQKVVNRL